MFAHGPRRDGAFAKQHLVLPNGEGTGDYPGILVVNGVALSTHKTREGIALGDFSLEFRSALTTKLHGGIITH